MAPHVAPSKMTLAQWNKQWLDLLQRPDNSRRLISRLSWLRYEQLSRRYILPALGQRVLQQITPSEIDEFYLGLEHQQVGARTVNYVHATLNACLNAAVRKSLLVSNPVARAEHPKLPTSNAGHVLDQEQLTALLAGFRTSSMYPIVAMAAFTGARRGEILALRWSDFDAANKTIRITRAVEQFKGKRSIKEPKTARGVRTFAIDDGLAEMLIKIWEGHMRVVAGVGRDDPVNLSLIKLPDDALIFPSPATPFDLTRLRNVDAWTREFCAKARRLAFAGLRFHDLRATHETMLLDAGVPVHVVAARCGHDPAVLLRSYAKRTKKADTSAAAVIGALSKAMLGS